MKIFMRHCTGAAQLKTRQQVSRGFKAPLRNRNPPPLKASISKTTNVNPRTQTPSLRDQIVTQESIWEECVASENCEELKFAEKIGEGSYGKIYKVEDPESGATFAVKEIATSGERGTGYPNPFRIENEADIHESVSDSPSVASFISHVKKEKSQCIAMELCEGGSLTTFVEQNGPMNERQVAAVARSAVDTIETFHSRKIFHGDIKAGNFVIGKSEDVSKLKHNPDELQIGWLKAIDFGCSKRMGMSKITNKVGTPTHWPPEVFAEKYGLEADLWSLGTMLYKLIARHLPYFTKKEQMALQSHREILLGIITKELDLESGPWTNISQECKDFIRKLLNLQAEKRMTACEAKQHPFLKQGRPVNLFDDYKLIGGVPAFVLDTEEDPMGMFRKYAVSSDGSRIAIVSPNSSICMYDLIDNCSLVAKETDIWPNQIYHISFWNDRNDKLVVLSMHKEVAFISIEREPADTSNKSEECEAQSLDVLVATHSFNIDRYRTGYGFSDVYTSGSMIWVGSVEDPYGTRFVTVSCVTEEGYNQYKSQNEAFKYMNDKQLLVGKDVIIATQWKRPIEKATTHMLSNITYESNNSCTSHIINGRAVAWDRATNNVLIWRVHDGKHIFDLYSLEAIKHNLYQPSVSLDLGKGLIDVKCECLDREAWPYEKLHKTNEKGSPLICILCIMSSASILLVWDTHLSKIIKQMDTTIDEMQISYDSSVNFAISPDMKWLAIGCWNAGIIGLFSFFAEVMVWSVRLELRRRYVERYIPMQFDALNSKLIIFVNDTVYIFMPPCLDKSSNLKLKYTDIIVDKKEEQKVHWTDFYTKSLSQNVMMDLLTSEDYYHERFLSEVRVAIPYSSSELAIMFKKEGSFSIIFTEVKYVFSPIIRSVIFESLKGNHIKHGVREIKLKAEKVGNLWYLRDLFYIFLYPNGGRTKDDIVILRLYKDHIKTRFVTLNGKTQEVLWFAQREVLCCFQSKDGMTVMCLKKYGILVFDLEQREITREVKYIVHLPYWLQKCYRERDYEFQSWFRHDHNSGEEAVVKEWVSLISLVFSQPDISSSGSSLLLGWSCSNNKPLLLTPKTKNQELIAISTHENDIMPCWAIDDQFEQFSFLEYEEHFKSITCIGIYRNKDEYCRRFRRIEWNPHLAKILENLNFETLRTYDMKLDKSSGCLWITALSTTTEGKLRLSLLPVGPYSMSDSLPHLHAMDFPTKSCSEDYLDRLRSEHEASFFNMPFNGMTNLHFTITCRDVDMMKAISKSAREQNVMLGIRAYQNSHRKYKSNLLEVAIRQKSEDLVWAVLDLYEKQEIPFSSAATVMKESFELLWNTNRAIFEEMLSTDLLAWELHRVDIPSRLLECNEHINAHIGTLEAPLTWKRKTCEEAASDICESIKLTIKEDDEQSIGDTKVKAIMKVFCLEDICKIGSNGIIRFLLSRRAPSHLFKTPLIKWTILWKWEHLWKQNSIMSCVHYMIMLALFTTYIICFSLYEDKLQNDVVFQWWLTIILLVLVLMVVGMCLEEVKELKIWYYAQAFTRTGAFVLMVENVIRDCIPFLMLLGIVLVGFSLALFTLFQYALTHEHSINGNNDKANEESYSDDINASFGSPQKALLTMFYAMIGTFEVEIYSNSGDLSPLIVFVFILYLSIQAVLMFNMLIAIMSDTFDKVKSTEEEQLLMGRARFVDACEAALSEKQIKKMEEQIGKYLYVVVSKDDSRSERNMWKGRVMAIEKTVQSIVFKSQVVIMTETQKAIKELENSMKEDINLLLEFVKNDRISLEEAMKSDIKALEEVVKNSLPNTMEYIDSLRDQFGSGSI
eukprot:g8481.t1